ncbi:MAG TPA: chemotaxis protein CheX [Leptospiraceae bacterium]|nr:chemotaxis protein CheX [Leptospiraceae bacterium]HMY68287.1 chemotaxis protein CheX [Leptospiraceae bacterium]HMZ58881.1 chemotaxis protein CheX [Leptospiraceae bacterium]HNF14160.1 chemotaxis protein CheX [Leptospiraceae bacterium]HNF24378.1 chemotaxis protein CheX [Leptospiraceae bacterium]
MEVRAEFVNPFIEAASLVFRDSLKLDLIRGKLKVRDSPVPSYEVAIIIGVVGSYKGEIVYSMNLDAAYKISKLLVPSLDNESVKDEYKDIIGEIGNMTTGNALRIFASNGQFVDITTPNVMEVSTANIQYKKTTTLSLNLYSRIGQIEINIAIL